MPHTCPGCHHPIDDDARYCTNCGVRQYDAHHTESVCQECGTAYTNGEKYCVKDGSRLGSDGHTYESIFGRPPRDFARASLGKRLGAAILDSLIGGLMSIPSIICLRAWQAKYYGYFGRDEASTYLIGAALFYLIPLTYALIKDGMGEGQSIGKRATDIMVIDLETQCACSKGKSFVRNFISLVIVMIPYIIFFRSQTDAAMIFFICMAFLEPVIVFLNSNGRKIGDLAANTQVINC